jgi:F-type H+-transporting ATPase subunit epsilon
MITFSLITPEKVVLTEEIYEIILPTANGQIAVLPGHMPLVTLLQPGVISLRRKKDDNDTELEHIATSGGFAEITGTSAKVLADTAERADDLDEMRIEEARKEAQEKLYEAKDEASYASALGQIQIELARQKVANMRKRRSSRSFGDTTNEQ